MGTLCLQARLYKQEKTHFTNVALFVQQLPQNGEGFFIFHVHTITVNGKKLFPLAYKVPSLNKLHTSTITSYAIGCET